MFTCPVYASEVLGLCNRASTDNRNLCFYVIHYKWSFISSKFTLCQSFLTSSFHALMQALSLLTIQILELSGALLLLKYTAKPQYKFSNFFKKNKLLSNRNWILSWALGFGFLVLLIFLTYLLADRLFGSQVGLHVFFQ